jgi:hypothetical protein
MYLTSFVHRDDLFNIVERWLSDRLYPEDAPDVTRILIYDGYIAVETVSTVAELLLKRIYDKSFRMQRIRFKGELRDAICRNRWDTTPRVEDLVRRYQSNPDFFYREAPINGAMCVDGNDGLIGLLRIKRPRRIAEKANRYIANWIFGMVQERAQKLAEERARQLGIPLQWLVTPLEKMEDEFRAAEEFIAQGFRESTIKLDRGALTIHDVAGIKIMAQPALLSQLEDSLLNDPVIQIVDKESYSGEYTASGLILSVPWDKESICRKYRDKTIWKKYLNRGIPETELIGGFESHAEKAARTMNLELILSTFPDMVESELGNSLHEERIAAQRDNRLYKGYIPMNVEFLIEYLFRVGFSPQVHLDHLPIKLWGRYLPDTAISYFRQLYSLPEYDLFF